MITALCFHSLPTWAEDVAKGPFGKEEKRQYVLTRRNSDNEISVDLPSIKRISGKPFFIFTKISFHFRLWMMISSTQGGDWDSNYLAAYDSLLSLLSFVGCVHIFLLEGNWNQTIRFLSCQWRVCRPSSSSPRGSQRWRKCTCRSAGLTTTKRQGQLEWLVLVVVLHHFSLLKLFLEYVLIFLFFPTYIAQAEKMTLKSICTMWLLQGLHECAIVSWFLWLNNKFLDLNGMV